MAAHVHHPLRRFALDHPYAPDWALLITGTLVALLLWARNS
jgi:hypothetical protein